MSFEGYYQLLCKTGHLRECDAYDDAAEDGKCSCGEPYVWRHLVDCTNDDGSEQRVLLVVRREAEVKTCDMGHVHVVREVEYFRPWSSVAEGDRG